MLKEIEIVNLRLKCIEIFATVSSKHGLEKGEVFNLAERAWSFINKTPLEDVDKGTPAKDPNPSSPDLAKKK